MTKGLPAWKETFCKQEPQFISIQCVNRRYFMHIPGKNKYFLLKILQKAHKSDRIVTKSDINIDFI